ncbi:hypothetical protein SAMN04515668_4498 [Hymenobacter arizonensis]|uniref:Uncharacterized protein n=1 Tax=Hymenobacter arizonensis TaxID=1227077 RepID=A0A1I6BFP9_HYMAR|nr:hypothetical protein SAMN04515668_4498 [Hymenobacter arizonensis]
MQEFENNDRADERYWSSQRIERAARRSAKKRLRDQSTSLPPTAASRPL